jgi:hypothetical protein
VLVDSARLRPVDVEAALDDWRKTQPAVSAAPAAAVRITLRRLVRRCLSTLAAAIADVASLIPAHSAETEVRSASAECDVGVG